MTRWLMPCIVATSLERHPRGDPQRVSPLRRDRAAGRVRERAHDRRSSSSDSIAWGIGALVLGTLAGAFAQLLVQVPAFFALHRFRFVIDWQHPGLRRLLLVLGPIAIGSAAGQIALFFDRYFASGLSVGSIAGMNYAVKLVGFPQQVFVAAIATVIFPALRGPVREQEPAGDAAQHRDRLEDRAVPDDPVGDRPVHARRADRADAVRARRVHARSDGAVRVAAAVCGGRARRASPRNVILTRYLFACNAVRATIAISVATVVVNVLLSIFWLPSLGARGLLLANAVSQTLQTLALGAVVWQLLGGFDVRGILLSAFKVLSCSAAMGVALAVVQIYRVPPEPTFIARATNLVEHLIFGGFLFLALARIVDSEELDLAIDILFRRKARELVPLAVNAASEVAVGDGERSLDLDAVDRTRDDFEIPMAERARRQATARGS